jgi:putative oxidoreductase
MGSLNKRRIIIIALRIALGGVWLYAAYTKLRDPWLLFAMSIDSYHLLPQWAVLTVARTLPWVELALGILLVGGLLLRYASIVSAAILAVFFGAMTSAYARGLAIDCGCFGPGDALSWKTLLRDGTLLTAALVLAFLCWRSVGRASVGPPEATA